MRRFSPQLRALDWLVARPIAHRGLHDVKVGRLENTASAFGQAMDGNYAIECDLQLTRDGEAVVFHDETLDRVMDATGWVRNYVVRDLKALNFKLGEDHMQTLGELLDQVAGKVTLVIELKSHFDGDVRLAVRALEVLAGYDGPYCLMSFDPVLVQAVAEMSPGTVRGITADRTTDSYYRALPFSQRLSLRHMDHLDKTRPHFVSYYFRDLPFVPVQAIRAAGHPVITWTIRNPEEERVARRYSDQITFEGYAAA
jgi:glycerophosphoryl diester phosphodiesterase